MFDTAAICLAVAEKLKDPDQVAAAIEREAQKGELCNHRWQSLTLSDGLPGIICFFAAMDEVYPGQDWDRVVHRYLKIVEENMGYSSLSLFSGITGIAFVIALSSKRGNCYRNVLSHLDSLLKERIEKEILQIGEEALKTGGLLPQYFYSLIDGLPGILAYISLRRDDVEWDSILQRAGKLLAELLDREVMVKGCALPGWYYGPEFPLYSGEDLLYPNGHFNLSYPYGLSGSLSALSILKLTCGVNIPSSPLKKMAAWLREKGQPSPLGGLQWTNDLSLECERDRLLPPINLNRDWWPCGTPAVSRSLYLAAKALNDKELEAFSEKTFLSIFKRPVKEWNAMAASFFNGKAGLLSLTHRMAKETHNKFLWDQLKGMEQEIQRFFDPSYPFGFRVVHITEDKEYRWKHNPGLLDGAVGICLSLLSLNYPGELEWERALLLS